jgi:ATP-binding cassette subfamily C protein CydC
VVASGEWGKSQPGPLIALFVFCALAAFEGAGTGDGRQHLGQVIASALRITQIAEQEPEVTFSAGPLSLSRLR